MKRSVGILGSGSVGQVLANGFKKLGYDVTISNRSGHVVENWDGKVSKFEEAAKNCDLVVLCVKGSAAEDLIIKLKTSLSGKTVIDTTNPISNEPPVDGVLSFFTTYNESLMERLQKIAKEVHFVKAFNSVGSGHMVSPKFSTKPTMFICGNDDDAKKEVTEILDDFGWEVEDMGSDKAARAIEPLCLLWCIPAIQQGSNNHAFKLLKK